MDNELTYFLWSEFDSPALSPNDNGLPNYSHNGREYLTNSGKENMDKSFVQLIDEVRGVIQAYNDETGRNLVFNINSGYRTQYYNDTLSNSVSNSAHIKGLAADISTIGWTLSEKAFVIEIFKKAGINRFGIGANFMHIDNDKTKPQNATWYY